MRNSEAMPWIKILDFISFIGQASDLQDMLERAATELTSLISCEMSWVILNGVDSNGALLPPSKAFSNNVPMEAQSAYMSHYYKVDIFSPAMVMRETCYIIDWHDRTVERSELATDYIRKLVHIDTNAGFTFYEPAAHTAGTLALGRIGGRVPSGRELRILNFLRPHFSNYFKLFDREAAYPRNAYSAAELADASGSLRAVKPKSLRFFAEGVGQMRLQLCC